MTSLMNLGQCKNLAAYICAEDSARDELLDIGIEYLKRSDTLLCENPTAQNHLMTDDIRKIRDTCLKVDDKTQFILEAAKPLLQVTRGFCVSGSTTAEQLHCLTRHMMTFCLSYDLASTAVRRRNLTGSAYISIESWSNGNAKTFILNTIIQKGNDCAQTAACFLPPTDDEITQMTKLEDLMTAKWRMMLWSRIVRNGDYAAAALNEQKKIIDIDSLPDSLQEIDKLISDAESRL